MPTPTTAPSTYVQLRQEAEARLKAGTASASRWSLGVDALQMLHRLSSDPDTAADALKLLHELQVHQVELDLQSEEMRSNEQRLVQELAHYRELYECAPMGYFRVDSESVIIEVNQAGAELLDGNADQLTGGRLDGLLAAASRPLLLGLLRDLDQTGSVRSCRVELDRDIRALWLVVSPSADKRSVLLTCCEYR
ncbi:MAG: PAS domain-containing protein [Alcanivoracaceae bacterium]